MDYHHYHINDILDNNRLFQVGSVKLLVVLVTDQTCINQSRLQKKKKISFLNVVTLHSRDISAHLLLVYGFTL